MSSVILIYGEKQVIATKFFNRLIGEMKYKETGNVILDRSGWAALKSGNKYKIASSIERIIGLQFDKIYIVGEVSYEVYNRLKSYFHVTDENINLNDAILYLPNYENEEDGYTRVIVAS